MTLLSLLTAPDVYAQRRGSKIVNDSVQSVYGPKTTRWITEKEIFYNRPYYHVLDTSIHNYHRWTYVQRFENRYKDLGVVGTALSQVYPVASGNIGAWSGYTAYEPYFQTENVRFFDTKSPYSRMHLIWGGNGRALSRIEYSRNVNSRWNFGFDYRPLLVDKQIQRTRKGDRQTVSHYYDFYTSYKSKDSRYLLLASFRRIMHRVKENGGVAGVQNFQGWFSVNARPTLAGAETREFRRQYHLYQQYELVKGLQVYNQTDQQSQNNMFNHDQTSSPGSNDPSTYFDHYESGFGIANPRKASDNLGLSVLANEAGLKTTLFRHMFLNGYYRIRGFRFSNPIMNFDSLGVRHVSGTEHYLGGRMELKLDTATRVSSEAETMLEGYYQIHGKLESKWLEGEILSSQSKPGFQFNAYRGSHDLWVNDFGAVRMNQISAKAHLPLSFLSLKAGVNYTRLGNYIFFRKGDYNQEQSVLPFQSGGVQEMLNPEISLKGVLAKRFFIEANVIRNQFIQNSDDALRIPDWFVNSSMYFEGFLFKKSLQAQIGVDMHWQSAYQALGYDLAIQQFYTQDTFTTPSYFLTDVFLNGRIKTGRFFVKYHNVLQLITLTGYLPTPRYPGQRNVLDFGFELNLFD